MTGGGDGSAVMLSTVPALPVFGYQQLPVLVGNSSHQKSTPFRIGLPSGVRPTTLS